MLISTENLTKKYGHLLALDSISLEVEKGTIGLLGPNGAGKSTLIKTLLGLLQFQEGTGSVLDCDIRRENKAIRKLVGYMPENDAYLPEMTGYDLVAYCARLCGLTFRDSKVRAHEVLDYLDMGEERYREVDNYSTGMRQRIKLAQAIVHDPQLVFLDEPTNGLDPAGREEMLEIALSLWEKAGISVILSSHLLPDVEKVCDRVIILNRGKVLAVDKIDNLKELHEESFRVKLRGNLKPFYKALKKKNIRVEEINPEEIRIYEEDLANTLEFFQLAEKHTVQVRKFQKTENTLEDIFIQTVGA